MLFNKLGSTQLGLPQNSDFKILASVIAMSIGIPLCLRILHLRQIGKSKQHEVRLALPRKLASNPDIDRAASGARRRLDY